MDALSADILRALAQAPGSGGMSLPRLGKRLGQEASVLMRHLSRMGAASIGGAAGPGWVRMAQIGTRWEVHLTDAGREVARGLAAG